MRAALLPVALLALAACHQRVAENTDDTSNATAAVLASIGNSAVNAADSMKDALARTPNGQDFADTAARSDAFEIAAAKLAGANAASARLKAFAREMIAAHTRSAATIKVAAARGPGDHPRSETDQRADGKARRARAT